MICLISKICSRKTSSSLILYHLHSKLRTLSPGFEKLCEQDMKNNFPHVYLQIFLTRSNIVNQGQPKDLDKPDKKAGHATGSLPHPLPGSNARGRGHERPAINSGHFFCFPLFSDQMKISSLGTTQHVQYTHFA